MPILAQGYEPYRGPVGSGRWSFLFIAAHGIRRNRRWYAWVLLVMALLFGSIGRYFMVIFVYGSTRFLPNMPQQGAGFVTALVNNDRFYPNMMSDQAFWALLIGALIGAGEIAEDLRSNALVFYLGRPVTRRDYVLGKIGAVSIPILLVTLVPVVLLFALHALFEGNWAWLSDRWRVLPAATGLALLECAFISAFTLGISALARRRRWATMAIAAVYFGMVLTAAVAAPPMNFTSGNEQREMRRRVRDSVTREDRDRAVRELNDAFDELGSPSVHAEWRALSPTASLQAAGRDLFGLPLPTNFAGKPHWVLLLGMTGALYGVLWTRVRAVEVVT